MTCCVMVDAPSRYFLSPRRFDNQRADHADWIHAGMLVEAPVFDGQHRLLDVLGDRCERHFRRFWPGAIAASSGASSVIFAIDRFVRRRDQRRMTGGWTRV